MVTSVTLFGVPNMMSVHVTVTETSLSPSRFAFAMPFPLRSMNVTAYDQSKFMFPMSIVAVVGVQHSIGRQALFLRGGAGGKLRYHHRMLDNTV